MADYEVSNILVGEAPIRVVAGQGFQTLDIATAAPLQQRYPRASAAERHAIERRYGVTYVVVDRADRALVTRLAEEQEYRRVYQNSGYCVYLLGGGKRAPVNRGTATR
jgi:hypothetical protein